MKTTHKLLTAVVILTAALQLNAAKKRAVETDEPKFELFNRDEDIHVAVKLGHTGREISRQKLKKNNKLFLPDSVRPLDTNEKITVYIYTGDQKTPDYIYEIDAPGKNKYLMWQSKSLLPQKASGPLGFLYLTNTSHSGYSLKNNVKAEQLVKK